MVIVLVVAGALTAYKGYLMVLPHVQSTLEGTKNTAGKYNDTVETMMDDATGSAKAQQALESMDKANAAKAKKIPLVTNAPLPPVKEEDFYNDSISKRTRDAEEKAKKSFQHSSP